MSHEKGIEAATEVISSEHAYQLSYEAVSKGIKAYLDASDMVIVPRELTDEMLDAGVNAREELFDRLRSEGKDTRCLIVSDHPAGTIYDAMVGAAPNPFQTPEESREKK